MAKRIEIGISYKKDFFKFREGDVDGSTECNMFTKEEVLSEINDLLKELEKGRKVGASNNGSKNIE